MLTRDKCQFSDFHEEVSGPLEVLILFEVNARAAYHVGVRLRKFPTHHKDDPRHLPGAAIAG